MNRQQAIGTQDRRHPPCGPAWLSFPAIFATLLLVATASIGGAFGQEGLGALDLVVRIDADGASIVSSRQIGSPDAERLRDGLKRARRPVIDSRTWTRLRPGTSELSLIFYDSDGEIMTRMALPGRAMDHIELPSGGGGLAGGAFPAPVDVRRIRCPVHPAARYLAFMRSEVMRKRPPVGRFDFQRTVPVDGDSLTLGGRVLRVYGLPRDSEDTGPARLPERARLPIGEMTEDGFFAGENFSEAFTSEEFSFFAATPVSGRAGVTIETIQPCDSEDCYTIVIMGDGFTSNDMDVFEKHAWKIQDELSKVEPFASLASSIAIHMVKVESPQSGIKDCPDLGDVESALGVFGHAPVFEEGMAPECQNCGGDLTTGPHILSIADTDQVYGIAEPDIPRTGVDAFVVIVNCNVRGGRSLMGRDIVLLPLQDPSQLGDYGDLDTAFRSVAVHEIGHVVGNLADEYIGCLDQSMDNVYPNMAYIKPDESLQTTQELLNSGDLQAQIDAVWWKNLANDPAGWTDPFVDDTGAEWFFYVYSRWDAIDETTGQSIQYTGHNKVQESGLTVEQVLNELIQEQPDVALYWGCQYTEPTPGQSCPTCCPDGWLSRSFDDDRSRNFFRGRVACKMRKAFCTFCCVCRVTLAWCITHRHDAEFTYVPPEDWIEQEGAAAKYCTEAVHCDQDP